MESRHGMGMGMGMSVGRRLPRTPLRACVCGSADEPGRQRIPKVKVCGVTSVQDAQMAASLGAEYIGMIMWPRAKRYVPLELAVAIAAAAKDNGAEPVGVFVDEGGEEITKTCQKAGIGVVQLHGDGSRGAYVSLKDQLKVIYVVHADKNGKLQTEIPEDLSSTWILVDGLQGGSGERFNWSNLSVPRGKSSQGWILAGGLNAENVWDAVVTLSPDIVDVSSGVTLEDKLRKDPDKVASFIQAAKGLHVTKI